MTMKTENANQSLPPTDCSSSDYSVEDFIDDAFKRAIKEMQEMELDAAKDGDWSAAAAMRDKRNYFEDALVISLHAVTQFNLWTNPPAITPEGS